MAVTSIWRIKGYINKVILYIENKDKTRSEEVIDNEKKSVQAHDILDTVIDYVGRDSATEEKVYVSGVNCTRQDALQKMMDTKLEFGKLGGTTAYHGYQSFAEGEINPDDATIENIRILVENLIDSGRCHLLGLTAHKQIWAV